MSGQDRIRAERRARETARLTLALHAIGPGACPWCYAAAVADWDYDRDRPVIPVEHERTCLGPSSRWHRRAATDWLLALLKVNGVTVGDYGEHSLARHHTCRL